MSGLESIPAPEALNQDRVSRDDREDMTTEDHRSQARLLATALDESCAYAKTMWNDLAAMREYLHDSLPAAPGPDLPAAGASPTGPSDDAGWQSWIAAFAKITSDLCGPQGDSGFGQSSATLLAQSRREVTVPTVSGVDSAPTPPAPAADDEPARSVPMRAGSGLKPFAAPFAYGGVGALIAALLLPRRRRLPGHRGG